MQSVFTGPVFVVRDNIDTDQIISAQFLNLVPTIAEEYEKLGSYALDGLPASLYPTRYVKEGQLDSEFPIVVAGKNFGCGSSREHPSVGLAYAGIRAVICKSVNRIFYRSSVNQGLPIILVPEAVDYYQPGHEVGIDFARGLVRVHDREFAFQPLPDKLMRIFEAKGLVNYILQSA